MVNKVGKDETINRGGAVSRARLLPKLSAEISGSSDPFWSVLKMTSSSTPCSS